MKVVSLLLLLCSLLLVGGCATPAQKLQGDLLDQIQPKVTTRRQVEALLGKPRTMETGGTGKTVALYAFSRRNEKLSGEMHMASKFFSLLYDREMVVEKKLLSESAVNVEKRDTRAPVEVGNPLSPEQVTKSLAPGMPRIRVIESLGAPTMEVLHFMGGTTLAWWSGKFSRGTGHQTEGQLLLVILDENGLVVTYRMADAASPAGGGSNR